LDELYNCRFGTFLLDNERQRQENSLDVKTQSLWPYLNLQTEKYLNPNYLAETTSGYFTPRSSTTDLNVWTSYYGRYRATMKYHHIHSQQTLDRQQPPSLILEAKQDPSEPNPLRDLMTKMFKKEFQDQIENFRNTNSSNELIFEVDEHKFKFIVENNKIRLLLCHPNDPRTLEKKQTQVPKFCGNENFVIIENYCAPDEPTESTEVILSNEDIDDFLHDMVQIEDPDPKEGLSSILPSKVMNMYEAIPSLSTFPQVAVGGIHSVSNWFWQTPK